MEFNRVSTSQIYGHIEHVKDLTKMFWVQNQPTRTLDFKN